MSDNNNNSGLKKIVYPSITDEVINQLLNAIRSEIFSPGEKLPSEPVLANQMGVSRNTLREALNTLIEKGYLYRQRGVGTFVTPQSGVMLSANLANVVSTSLLIKNQKKTPGQKSFSYKFEPASKEIAGKMQVAEKDQVMHISRVRTANGIPVIQSEEYIPGDLPGLDYDFDKCETMGNWSIYDHLKKYDYAVKSIITHVHAIAADKELAVRLEVEENTPLLCLEQTQFANSYIKPVLYCMNYHNDKIINFMLVRTG